MRFKNIKCENEIDLNGVTCEVDFHNDVPVSVILTDYRGRKVKIAIGPYNHLEVMVQVPEEVKDPIESEGGPLGVEVPYDDDIPF